MELGKSVEGARTGESDRQDFAGGGVPATPATEYLMTVEDRNRRSGQHDKWIIADSLRKVQLGEWGRCKVGPGTEELE